jgi:hypothetical protein
LREERRRKSARRMREILDFGSMGEILDRERFWILQKRKRHFEENVVLFIEL